ncbi:MAG TPA: tripartite tricarboxylate transporter substrate binding protein [Ramlibacter sp.]|nr:tripartite tricarboxylate transporter substrate binding protein [Ramlibacter sp.]
MNRKNFLRGVAALALAATGATDAADPWPTRPVRIVVPVPPGGPSDAYARAMAQRMGEEWGHQVIVDNKPGAGEIVGAQLVAKAPADGHTMLFTTESAIMLNKFAFLKPGYDVEKDLLPVTQMISGPLVLVVPASLPVNTLDEFVALARSRKDKPMTYGSAGIGSVLQLAMVSLAQQEKLDLVHAPYRGAAPLMQDLVSGQVDSGWVGVSGAVPFVRDRKLKALVVGGTHRAKALPDTPVYRETKTRPSRADFLFGLVAPAGTPAAVAEKVAATVRKIQSDPKFRETHMDPFGYESIASTPAEFARFIANDRPLQGDRIRLSGLKPE